MSIESVQVATVKVTVFKDECKVSWEQFCGAPLKYVIQQCPLLRYCRSPGCSCPCWHNNEDINVSDAIVDVWRRQFLRAGYKPEPPATSCIYSVCIRAPTCLLSRLLAASGEGGVYTEPRSMDSKEVHRDYEVVWIPKADKATLSHLRQTNPAAIGMVRIGDRFGLRVLTSQAADLHKTVRPDAVYLSTGVRQQWLVGPIPYGTDRKALCKALLQMPWEVKPLQPIAALDGQRGVMWTVVAVSEPPTNIIHMSHGEVLITKQKELPVPRATVMKPVATPATISLCGSGKKAGKEDPWVQVDPWSNYMGPKAIDPQAAAMTTATESMHQLESKIEKAVLSKIPQYVAMDQDDIPDRLHDLETKFHTLLGRQQKLEGIVTEQSVQQSAQLGQMQAQINAQGQQLTGQMEAQQHQIQGKITGRWHTGSWLAKQRAGTVAFVTCKPVWHPPTGPCNTRSARGPSATTWDDLKYGSAWDQVTIATPSDIGPTIDNGICDKTFPPPVNAPSWRPSLAGSRATSCCDLASLCCLALWDGFPIGSFPERLAICIWSSSSVIKRNFTLLPRVLRDFHGAFPFRACNTCACPMAFMACCERWWAWSEGTPCSTSNFCNVSPTFSEVTSPTPLPHNHGCHVMVASATASWKSLRKCMWCASAIAGVSGSTVFKTRCSMKPKLSAPHLKTDVELLDWE